MIQYHQLITVIKLFHTFNCFPYQLRVRIAVIEEPSKRNAEVVAYSKQFRKRRQGLTL
ncbi:hypothetical protein [uncultured Ruminococcus sp.]|uniref:hypothetical protein n=1 Tax=uncultured Ruminococcus sp. TaxID=165186 RepID=UPI0025D0FBD0|nr:hypothetical protein [uncultured Ruminococcus sp.]